MSTTFNPQKQWEEFNEKIKGKSFQEAMLEGLYREDTIPLKARSLVELENERMQWAIETFPEATAVSSLYKLRTEIDEIEEALLAEDFPKDKIAEEYSDGLMCLFDSAGRAGISTEEIICAFEAKLMVNKSRKWVKNADNTYSHIK